MHLHSVTGLRLLALGVFLSALAGAQVVIPPVEPQIDSTNTVTADPTVPRPHTKHCTVPLFNDLEFADYTPKTFAYAPPAGCEGPWQKVVFTADFTVTAGRQFDRTASFYLGHANIYYGTTAEPTKAISPSWHVERDVTDLSAIFSKSQSGEAILGNFVGVSNGVTYNGLIYANAALEFYVASPYEPAPAVPDVVVPMPDAEGGAATLNTTTDRLTQAMTLPENTERVYLDVITQSQSNDEFWYTCAPNDVATELDNCGNTPFREAEISIDDQPAGVAPVYPWIFTGGIDPDLWHPLPGVQTLNFKPYRVDLTPFAGVLADGSQHTVAISVFNADSYFLATANLLAFTDHRVRRVTGGIISTTLTAAPTPTVTENLQTEKNGDVSGTVTVTSDRSYVIKGYLETSHGRVETTVDSSISFSNLQKYVINSSTYLQDVSQSTVGHQRTTFTTGIFKQELESKFSYPLTLHYDQSTNSSGTTIKTTVKQSYDDHRTESLNWARIFEDETKNEVHANDTLNFDAQGNFINNTDQGSHQRYETKDSLGFCYDRFLASEAGKLTEINDGQGCQWW